MSKLSEQIREELETLSDGYDDATLEALHIEHIIEPVAALESIAEFQDKTLGIISAFRKYITAHDVWVEGYSMELILGIPSGKDILARLDATEGQLRKLLGIEADQPFLPEV